MKTEFQVIEKNSGTELFKSRATPEIIEEFDVSGEKPCRRVGDKINVNGSERAILDIYFCLDYDYDGLTRITITVEQIQA